MESEQKDLFERFRDSQRRYYATIAIVRKDVAKNYFRRGYENNVASMHFMPTLFKSELVTNIMTNIPWVRYWDGGWYPVTWYLKNGKHERLSKKRKETEKYKEFENKMLHLEVELAVAQGFLEFLMASQGSVVGSSTSFPKNDESGPAIHSDVENLIQKSVGAMMFCLPPRDNISWIDNQIPRMKSGELFSQQHQSTVQQRWQELTHHDTSIKKKMKGIPQTNFSPHKPIMKDDALSQLVPSEVSVSLDHFFPGKLEEVSKSFYILQAACREAYMKQDMAETKPKEIYEKYDLVLFTPELPYQTGLQCVKEAFGETRLGPVWVTRAHYRRLQTLTYRLKDNYYGGVEDVRREEFTLYKARIAADWYTNYLVSYKKKYKNATYHPFVELSENGEFQVLTSDEHKFVQDLIDAVGMFHYKAFGFCVEQKKEDSEEEVSYYLVRRTVKKTKTSK